MSDMNINLQALMQSGQLPPGVLAAMQGAGVPMPQPMPQPVAPQPVPQATPAPQMPAAPVTMPAQLPVQQSQNQEPNGQLQYGQSPPRMTPPVQQGPQTGLIGSEQALQGGAEGAMSALMQGYGAAQAGLSTPVQAPTVGPADMSQVNSAINQGVNQATGYLNPYAAQGVPAINMQAALSGAMGNDAQRQAMQNFSDSPGQQYMRERAERALLRNSAALGGLGGGRVRQELQRQAIGEAAQDFDRNFARVGSVAQAGQAAAGQQAGITGQLRGQQAGIAGNLEGQRMGVQGQLTGQGMQINNARDMALAELASGTGQNAANIAYNTGANLASGRTRAGQDIAGAVGGTVSALANLANQQGQGISDTIGSTAGDLSNIISGAGGQQAASQQNLATILANIASGQGSQTAALPGIPGIQETEGILGKVGDLASGVGAVMAASDIRLKENVRPIGKPYNGIQIYVWDWNEDGQRVTGETSGAGVIAQEVRETHPTAVVEGDDGWLRVNYGVLFNG